MAFSLWTIDDHLVDDGTSLIECEDCPCEVEADVLIWLHSDDSFSGAGTTYDDLAAIYTALGLTVHDHTNWTGDIDDYSLVFLPWAIGSPPWWGSITGNTWTGRLVITGEASDSASSTWISGESATTGMTVDTSSLDLGEHDGTVETHALTSGQTPSIKYAFTALVGGGTALSLTDASGDDPEETWLAQNKPGGSNIDFVVAGDTSFLSDQGGFTDENETLLENFWNVAL